MMEASRPCPWSLKLVHQEMAPLHLKKLHPKKGILWEFFNGPPYLPALPCMRNLLAIFLSSHKILFYFVVFLQDPLMRRIEGSQILPAGAVIHHRWHLTSWFTPSLQFDLFKLFLLHRRPHTGKRNVFTSWVNDFQFQAKKIDIFSRWIFPFTFLMFNIWYWSYYLSQAQSKAKKREES